MFRVLRPHGWIGSSDVIGEDGTIPEQRAQIEEGVGCVAGALTISEYRDLLLAAGFVATSITATVSHGDGIHSSIIQATKPAITTAVAAAEEA